MADTPIQAFDLTDKISDSNKRNVAFVAELFQGDEKIATSVSCFAPIKHLALTDPRLNVDTVVLKDETLIFNVSAKSMERFVELTLDGVDVVFNNYFDIPAGTSVKVSAPLPSHWTLEQAKKALQVRSLIDSY